MHRPRVLKICGITRREDAMEAVRLGATRLGFVLAPSPRQVDLDRVCSIVQYVPDHVRIVGVFVNPSPDEIEEAFERMAIHSVQLHGDETPEFCHSLSRPWYKAIRAETPDDLAAVDDFACEEVLIEGRHPEHYGGTGIPMPEDVLEAALQIESKRVILAGGLGPATVRQVYGVAQRLGRPIQGLDASSKLESAPGIKDHGQMERFFTRIMYQTDGTWGG